MSDDGNPVWGIHMGRPGGHVIRDSLERAEHLQTQGYVALGWPEIGDMSNWPASREEFRSLFQERHGYNASTRSVAAASGMLFRFVHEMRIGDLIVTPSPVGRPIRIGRITEEYVHNPTFWSDYPALRGVDWIVECPRDDLSAAARKSLKAQRSLFRVQAGADDFRRMALGNCTQSLL